MKTKKYRIRSKFRFTAFIAVMVVSIAFITGTVFGLNDASSLSEEPSCVSVRVQSGDTLWNIASEYGPKDMDRRKVIYEICRLNNIDAGSIQPGQSIIIPEEI